MKKLMVLVLALIGAFVVYKTAVRVVVIHREDCVTGPGSIRVHGIYLGIKPIEF